MPDSIVKTVPLILPNGVEIRVEANAPDDREADVAFSDVAEVFSMDNITGAIEGIAQLVKESMVKIAPKKASVEFAIEVGLESGKLTALWVKGTGKANLKVAMEWSHD